jgi:putative membrane protein
MSAKWCLGAVFGYAWICGVAYAQSAKLSVGDKQFLKMAAETHMAQAHLGQMAQAQGSEDRVKTFGKTLDQDHTKSYSELSGLATKVGQTIPKGIDVRRDKGIAQLMHMKGKSFDRTFVRNEIQDHRRVLAEFKREASRGESPEIKAYAQQMIPTIENHLHEAESLANGEKHA